MELREKIIKEALELFGEFGYEKTTIAQIVKRSGSSKGGFYHHFDGKKEILDEITKMFLGEIIDGYNEMMKEDDKDTIELLNNVFLTINQYKKQKLADWTELINLYSHKDSYSVVQKLAFDFIEVTTDIYERLILRAVQEGLINPKSPKALASMWCHEVTRLYGKVTEIALANADKELYDDFIERAEFVEDTINQALNAGKDVISIKQPAIEYLDMTIEMMNKVNAMNNQ